MSSETTVKEVGSAPLAPPTKLKSDEYLGAGLWEYRYFVWMLVSTEFKKRYTQSFLGLVWLILEPLILVLSLSFIFTVIGRKSRFGIPFPVFFYSGVIAWNIFASALGKGATAIIADKPIMSKVNYPRIISIIRATCVYVTDFLFALIPYIGILIYYRVEVTWGWAYLPMLLGMIILLSFSLTLFLAPMNVYVRDVGILSRSIKSIWFWFTPIIFHFPAGSTAEKLYYVNPMAGLIVNIRKVMLYQEPLDWMYLICPTVWIIVLLVAGRYLFKKLSGNFIDVL